MSPIPKRPRRRTRAALRGVALAASLGLFGATAAAADAPPPGAPEGSPTVMAKLTLPWTEAHAREVAAREGLTLTRMIEPIGWAEYAIPGPAAPARDALRRDSDVMRIDWMQPGETVEPQFTPRDEIFTSNLGVPFGGGLVPDEWHWTTPNFPAAWDLSTGRGAIVAVIDSEFDTEHAELKLKLLQGMNFDSGSPAYRTANVRASDGEVQQAIAQAQAGGPAGILHGSHVAGLVGAQTDNGVGVSGACFDCAVLPLRISTNFEFLVGGQDDKFIADLTEALTFAANSPAAVINMSLGTRRPHQPLADAVNLAYSRGKVIVVSAGNDQLSFPGVLHYPAALPHVIAVGATTPADTIADFSSNGDYVDVSAPGQAIASTFDSRFPGNFGQGYEILQGTSMASPIVAGLAGLMKAIRPDLTPDEVEALIESTAVDRGLPGKDQVYGWGRIDAFKAVQAAKNYVRPAPPPPPAPVVQAVPPPVLKAKRGTTIFFTAKRQRVRVRKPLILEGRTKPAARGVYIRLQRFRLKGGWSTIKVLRTTSAGRFRIVFRATKAGPYQLRILLREDTERAQATSRTISIRALR